MIVKINCLFLVDVLVFLGGGVGGGESGSAVGNGVGDGFGKACVFGVFGSGVFDGSIEFGVVVDVEDD
ncbi:hypothetical protein Tco_0741251 [Tanacetum coccineum]